MGNVLRDSLNRVWNGTTLVQTGTYGTGNRIQNFGACSYTTAADGSVTQRTCAGTVTDFWWSSEGRLDSLRHAGTMIRHRYDAGGRLVKREVGSSTRYFLWHGDHLFAELDANGVDVVEYSYYPGMDRPHAIGLADSVYFHHLDGLGNVIGLVKHDQALRAQYTYALRGNATWSSEDLSGLTNRARFKGALRFGEETELYYMRNRWYEPKTGRFLSEDPIGLAGGINPYTYAADDPVNARDATGLTPCQSIFDSHWDYTSIGVAGTDQWTSTFHECWDDDDRGGGGAGDRDPRGPGSSGGPSGTPSSPATASDLVGGQCRAAVATFLMSGTLDALTLVGGAGILLRGAIAYRAGTRYVTRALANPYALRNAAVVRRTVRAEMRDLAVGPMGGVTTAVPNGAIGEVATGSSFNLLDYLPLVGTWRAYQQMNKACG